MGDNVAPAFGSSTYDWAMRIGSGRYTADEWLNHLTSTRKVNFKVFGKPSTRTVRDQKRFKYDSGPFAGREANVTKEELLTWLIYPVVTEELCILNGSKWSAFPKENPPAVKCSREFLTRESLFSFLLGTRTSRQDSRPSTYEAETSR